jgi:HSP20 family protein
MANDSRLIRRSEQVPAILTDPAVLLERMNRIYEAVARRAFEIFEREGISGRDTENWYLAEAEMLHPVHLEIEEGDKDYTVRAEVPGFGPEELQVSVEPQRVTICGKRARTAARKDARVVYQDRCMDEVMRAIELPSDVDPAKATATLNNGVLELTMQKAAEGKAKQVEVRAARSGG